MKTLIAAISLVALVASCGFNAGTGAVVDVTRSETITIKKNSLQGPVHSLSIWGLGDLHGTAQIKLVLDDRP